MKTSHVSHLFYLPLSIHFGKYEYSVVDQMDNFTPGNVVRGNQMIM